MKKQLLSVFALLVIQQTIAQLPQTKNWLFGTGLGFSISDLGNEPVAILGGQTSMVPGIYEGLEGSASISDQNGTLLFYTDGRNVFGNDHQILENGDGLLGGASTSQVLIVPMPETSGMYYVFTQDDFLNNLTNGLRYSIVDVCKGGNGEVIEKNSLLLAQAGEKVAAVRHANGIDYWVFVHQWITGDVYMYLITKNGIGNPIITGTNPDPGLLATIATSLGCAHFNSDGNRVAFAMGNSSKSQVMLFDVDRSTGQLSNKQVLVPRPAGQGSSGCYYGIGWLGESDLFITDLSGLGKIWHYDLGNQNPGIVDFIVAAPTAAFGAIQAVSNDLLYVANNAAQTVDAIVRNTTTDSFDYIGPVYTAEPIEKIPAGTGFYKTLYMSLPNFVDGPNPYDNNSCTVNIEEKKTSEYIGIYNVYNLNGIQIASGVTTLDVKSLQIPDGVYVFIDIGTGNSLKKYHIKIK